jgi:hypothetical protein
MLRGPIGTVRRIAIAVRTLKMQWCFIATLAAALAVALIRHEIYLHPTRDGLAAEIARVKAVIAYAANIERNEPPSQKWIKSNAIELENPALIDSMPNSQRPCILVIADDPSFAGDVALAIRNRQELNVDVYLIMGSCIRIFRIAQDGTPRAIDWAYVSSIEVEPR